MNHHHQQHASQPAIDLQALQEREERTREAKLMMRELLRPLEDLLRAADELHARSLVPTV
jgi:hypothetical protein